VPNAHTPGCDLSDKIPILAGERAPSRPVTSLSKRYAVKLAASIAAACAGVAVDSLGSRALGPADYGQFYFLQQFFTQIFVLLGSSISLAVVVRSARRPLSRQFTFIYLVWLLAIPFFTQGFVEIAGLFGFARYLWPGSALLYVHLGALASYLLFIGREGTALGDAYGLTVRSEWARVVQRFLAFVLIVVLFVSHLLGLLNFFLYTCVVNAVLAVVLFGVLRSGNKLIFPRHPFRVRGLKAAAAYFYSYSSPLVIYVVISIAGVIFDRWLLQVAAGNIDQGFFSLAYQVSQMMLLFVTAFVPLLMREMSIAHGAANYERLSSLFRRSLSNLYFVSGFFACFVAVFCDRFALLVGGKLFAASAFSIALVVLSAMHRTCGQVTAIVYYATGRTALFRNIAIVTNLGGILLTYLLVANPRFGGLGMGANGLAIKTFLFEMFGVNTLAYFATRFLGIDYWRVAVQQLICAASLLGVAGIVRFCLYSVAVPKDEPMALFLYLGFAGILYTALAIFLLYLFPDIAGLRRVELNKLQSLVLRVVRRDD